MEHWHTSWLSRSLTVVSSNDPSLVGRSGTVVNESRNMITIIDLECEIQHNMIVGKK